MKIKIEFHYTFLIMATGFILTGQFKNIIILTSLIIIHELGHYLTAIFFKFNVQKIIIYPYGGITKLEELINKNINQELLIASAGIIYQTLYYFLIINSNCFSSNTIQLFKFYHYNIVFFNILPIYPLDGSKIISLFLNKFLPFNLVNYLTIIISSLTVTILLIITNFNYSYIMSISILLYDIFNFYKNIQYYYNKFLLERYLYKITYPKLKIINNPQNFYKNYNHIIKKDQHYYQEQDLLKKIFKNI